VGDLPVEERRVAATDLVVLRRLVLGDELELGVLVRVGRLGDVGDRLLGDEVVVDDRFEVRLLGGGNRLALLGGVPNRGGQRRLVEALGHGHELPRRRCPLEGVQRGGGRHPQRGEEHHEAHQPGERGEEPQPGPEVRGQQHVHRPAEQADRGGDDEDPEDRRVPRAARRRRRYLGEDGCHVDRSVYRLRS